MLRRHVRNDAAILARRCAPVFLMLCGVLGSASLSRAQVNLGPITVGAGLQTSFANIEPNNGNSTDQFQLDHVRLYVNGPVYEDIKFMFNTDYDSVTNKIGVLDAVAQIEVAPEFNIWVGRFLPPSDRANLYGPFFAHEWLVYTDGIQDGYPFVFQGRDNGVTYWGTFAKKIKVSAGAFDGKTADGIPNVIGAARVQIDFWDPEDGYYLNGTYYGDKNLLAIGGATQVQNGKTATTVDFLLEKKVLNGGAFTIESEYANYNRLGGYDIRYAKSDGAYGLASFLFPKKVGVGKFEILGKYAKANFTEPITAVSSYNQKTTEFNLNYVIKQFNARVMAFGQNITFNGVRTGFWQAGIGLQVQM